MCPVRSLKFIYFLLPLVFCGVFLGGCVLVRLLNKNFNHNQYRIVRVVLDGQTFNFRDLILEAQRPHLDSEDRNTPPTNAQAKDKLELLQEELKRNIKNLDIKDLPPDASMIRTDISRLQADIEKNQQMAKQSKIKSTPMGHVEFDQKELHAYGVIYCNKYFISYSFRDDDHLNIEDKGISRKVCSNEKLMAFELAFYNHLKGTFNITRGKNTLLLENPNMQIYLQH